MDPLRRADLDSKVRSMVLRWMRAPRLSHQELEKRTIMEVADLVEEFTPIEKTRDYVKFTLNISPGDSSNKEIQEMLRRTLGLRDHEYRGTYDTVVICRPSQFARYLIARNELGLRNGFKELRAKLFEPKSQPEMRPPVDCTRRASTYCMQEKQDEANY